MSSIQAELGIPVPEADMLQLPVDFVVDTYHFAVDNPNYPFSGAAVRVVQHPFLGPDIQLVEHKPAPSAEAAMAPSTYSEDQDFAKEWNNFHSRYIAVLVVHSQGSRT